MTFWDLTRVLVRYWVLIMIAALVTVGVGMVAISDTGVYFSRTELVFLAPTSSLYPNALKTQSEDLIDTAGIVAKRVSGPGEVTKFASPDATLVGMGVRDGWSLRLPDTGGQWATNFTTQTLLLDVVAPSRDVAENRQKELAALVSDTLQQLQREAGVKPVNDITIIAAPESAVIFHIGGSRTRTLAMIAILGIAATLSVVMAVDRYRRRQRAPGQLAPQESLVKR